MFIINLDEYIDIKNEIKNINMSICSLELLIKQKFDNLQDLYEIKRTSLDSNKSIITNNNFECNKQSIITDNIFKENVSLNNNNTAIINKLSHYNTNDNDNDFSNSSLIELDDSLNIILKDSSNISTTNNIIYENYLFL